MEAGLARQHSSEDRRQCRCRHGNQRVSSHNSPSSAIVALPSDALCRPAELRFRRVGHVTIIGDTGPRWAENGVGANIPSVSGRAARANQDRRMPAEERKPSAQKAGGRWFETKEAGRNAQPSLMYMYSGAGNGTRTRDPLLGNQMHPQFAAARGPSVR